MPFRRLRTKIPRPAAPLFVLVDEHGTPMGDFRSPTEALKALDELISDDPSAATDCFVAELDSEGRRVGTFTPTNLNQGWFE